MKCKRSIKSCLMNDLKEYHYFCEKMKAATDFNKKTAYSKYLQKWQNRFINCSTLHKCTILPPRWEQFYLKICTGINVKDNNETSSSIGITNTVKKDKKLLSSIVKKDSEVMSI